MPWRRWTRLVVACDPCATLVQCFHLGPGLSVYEEGHSTLVRTPGIQIHRPLRLLDPHRQRVISRFQYSGCCTFLLLFTFKYNGGHYQRQGVS